MTTGKIRQVASSVIEQVASDNSSSVYIYDLAEHAGFGSLTKELGKAGKGTNVVSLQTRSGAGLSLVGRLSEEGTSKDVEKDSVLTVYNTPGGLAVMAPSFAYLPKPIASKRVVVQVPTVTPAGQTLELSPTIASLSLIFTTLPDSFAVILSSSPQESVDLAAAAYSITDSHVIHLFDHHSAGREIGHTISRSEVRRSSGTLNVKDGLDAVGYAFFDYFGDSNATKVLVLLNGPLALAAKFLSKNRPDLGVLVVRVLKPWDDEQFLSILPASAKFVHVLDEVPTAGTQGVLYADVFSACLGSNGAKVSVRPVRIVPSHTQEFIKSPSTFASFLDNLVPATSSPISPSTIPNAKRLIFFGTPSSGIANLPCQITKTFLANESIQTRSLTKYDVFSKPGGLEETRILLTPKEVSKGYVPLHVHLPIGLEEPDESKADFVAVLDQSLLKSHAILNYSKSGSVVVLFSSWTTSEILSNVPADVLSLVRERNVKVYNLNLKDLEVDSIAQGIIGHFVFLRLYLGPTANEVLLRKLAHSIYGASSTDLNIDKLNAKAWSALEKVDVSAPEEPSAEETKVDLKAFEFNAIDGIVELEQLSLPGAHISSWHEAARHILFPDAFVPTDESSTEDEHPQIPALRPEIPDRTYLVTCSVNRRLTPLDYDRNVFHLEFDTSGTGLKYAIGEALGVYGWNDADEVLDFCKWHGVDPDRLITLPVPGVEGKVHTRTIFQALQQQIDLFGKPPKSFYADLSNHATSRNDKLTLQFIGSPEGSSMFKKLSEKETVTFADVLRTYKSARPSIEVLCEMIGDIKPRHYSIASAQSVVGDRVDLLVVTVEWQTPSGSPRYGQCTRYLAGLKVGQKVTVSIKPSVMKLPPSDLQPLILAGLGTGAAPFRAFLQHRALLASQGGPVGPLYYYFGSRYRSKEYLYGEEIEAFILDKTITRAGLAFSRDGPRKVYIQHKMVEDAETLVNMLYKEKGVFYLCGPTWPVPDVYETLVKALAKYDGLGETEAGEYLEGLKEEERYVLEVY
ncbi:MET10 [Sanghuangporus sanghuang]